VIPQDAKLTPWPKDVLKEWESTHRTRASSMQRLPSACFLLQSPARLDSLRLDDGQTADVVVENEDGAHQNDQIESRRDVDEHGVQRRPSTVRGRRVGRLGSPQSPPLEARRPNYPINETKGSTPPSPTWPCPTSPAAWGSVRMKRLTAPTTSHGSRMTLVLAIQPSWHQHR